MLAIWAHLVAAALWTGGLLALAALLMGPLRPLGTTGGEDVLRRFVRREAVRRFSRVAAAAVLAVLLTGLYNALLYVSGPSTLLSTPYGRALAAKLGLTALMLAAGGVNLVRGDDGPLEPLVGVELGLSAGVFVAAGLLTSLPPAN